MNFRSLFTVKEHNFIFLGEAGSGKSEIAINFAIYLKQLGDKPVHFFDMDMTKPLFRSRDTSDQMEKEGIVVHYEEQYMDAPTLAGGVNRLLKDQDCYVVMDVGGDYIGARAIGGFAPVLNSEQSKIYYVINTYRPWSYDVEHIDWVMREILGVSHIIGENVSYISNPNVGKETTVNEVIVGHLKFELMLNEFQQAVFVCVREDLYPALEKKLAIPVLPINLYVEYPWTGGEVSG